MSTKKRTSAINGGAAPASAPIAIKTTETRRRVSRPRKRTDDDDDDDVDAVADGMDGDEKPVRRRGRPRRALLDSISYAVYSPPSSFPFQLSLPYWVAFVIIEPALMLASWLLFTLNPGLAATVLYSGLVSHWKDDAMWSELTLLSLSYFFNLCLLLGLIQPMLLSSAELSRSMLARFLAVLLLGDVLHVYWTVRYFPDSSAWGMGMWSSIVITVVLAAVRVAWLLQNTDIIAMTGTWLQKRWQSIFEE